MKTYVVLYKKKEEKFTSLFALRYYLRYVIKDYGDHNTRIYSIENNEKKELSIEEVLL